MEERAMNRGEQMVGDVVADGVRLIEAWCKANERLERARREVNSASCEVGNATNALGRWMVPSDVKPDEVLSVWHGDSLISVRVLEKPDSLHTGGRFEITVRARGKSLMSCAARGAEREQAV